MTEKGSTSVPSHCSEPVTADALPRTARTSARWLIPWAILLGLPSGSALAPQNSEDSHKPMLAAEVVRRFGSSVVLVQAELPNGQTSIGSGFVASTGGVVATSLHLLDTASALQVRIGGERFEVVRVRAFDVERDLALVQIESSDLAVLVIGDSSSLQRGDPIYVISNPLGLAGTVSEGILSAWREPSTEEADEVSDLAPVAHLQSLPLVRLLQISAPLSPGSSGAPVFDASGCVVAMVAGGLGRGALDLNFAVPIEELVPLLEVDEGWDLSSLQKALDQRRQDLAEPHLLDARFYLEGAELEEALHALDRALGVFPRSEEALVLEGEVLVLTGRIEEAEQVFRAATAANPESARAWVRLGEFVLEHRPSSSTSFRVGELAPLTQRLAEATAAFERALEIDPWHAEAAFGLANAYLERGRLDDAREMLEQAVESDRDHLQAALMLGRLCMVLQDFKAAEDAFQRARWIDRDDPQADCELSDLYRRTGDDRARRHRQRCFELRGSRP